ncbi:MAG: peptidoglycan-binding protein [Candidatus Nomurabacteria bacterium]|nr:MAG: peptidoglycan-binding protein [Candidatus Nomurabacteria bacterium]
MNLFKDPRYSSLRLVILIVLILISGYFINKYTGSPDNYFSGKVGDVANRKPINKNIDNIGMGNGQNELKKYLVNTTTEFDYSGGCTVTFFFSDGTSQTYSGTPAGLFPEDGCNIGGEIYYGEDTGTDIVISIDQAGEVSVNSSNPVITTQMLLWMRGFLPENAITGTMGGETVSAINSFQSYLGVSQTGEVNSAVESGLNNFINNLPGESKGGVSNSTN